MELGKLIQQLYPFESLGASLIFIFGILCTIIQVAPIKINPWDWLLGWIGDRFNAGMNAKIDYLDKRIDRLEGNFDTHIKDKALKDLEDQRRYLINFVNEGVNGMRHSKESFEDAIRACDSYEEYVKANNIHNGVINSTIAAIRNKYEEHLVRADFPTADYYIKD